MACADSTAPKALRDQSELIVTVGSVTICQLPCRRVPDRTLLV
jgi:hypothetical protein